MDDLIYTNNDLQMIDELKQSMNGEFSMTDLGRMRYLIEIEVNQRKNGIFIHQQKYATGILSRFGMWGCKKVCSLLFLDSSWWRMKMTKFFYTITYTQMVGSLMCLLATRNGMTFSVSLVARYMDIPNVMHVSPIKRSLRYLQGTLSLGILSKSEDGSGL